jgi:protein involved in polysaccharide export with SLBB domain
VTVDRLRLAVVENRLMRILLREFGNAHLSLGAGALRAISARMVRLAVATLMAIALVSPAAAAEPYRLGVGDQIKLVVVEEPQTSGTFVLSESGTIALSGADPIALLGMTVEEATEAIRAVLSRRIVDPTVSLDIAQIRPFYIIGDVANPGAYPGQARLTLFKAVAIAGGFRQNSETYQASITGIRASETLVVARRQLLAAQVLKARLETQLSDAPSFEYAVADDGDAEAKAIVEREKQTFTLQNTSLARQLDLLAKEATVRDDEIAALTARIDATAEQLAALKTEIETVQALVDKGLTQAARIFQLNREQSQLLSTNLQTTVSLNQARQARIQLELQLSSLPSDRRLELLARLQEATGTIDRLDRQIAADQAVQQESTQFGFGATGDRVTRRFRIQHEDGSVVTDLSDPAAAVLPGDVIEVTRVLRQD